MPEPRQRPIPVTRQEREDLEQHKRRYEAATGGSGDWGQFLGAVALLGLAAAGIYTLVKAKERSPQSFDVQCPTCNGNFLLAAASGTARALYTTCPLCNAELVVNLGGLPQGRTTPM